MGSVEQSLFGILNGVEVHRFVLRNKVGWEVEVCSLGASLLRVSVPDRHGELDNVTLGLPTLDAYDKDVHYVGRTIGRVANRIENAAYVLGEETVSLEANLGPHLLHGGEWGIHRACFLSEVRQEDGVSEVCFSYSSADGEGGFPGKVDIAVTYSWQDDGTLRVDIRAETDQRTPLNMTHHAYWNLGGSFGREVWSHELQIPSSYYATTNDECISDGKVAASRLTPLDFRFRRPVGHGVGLLETSGYDHCLILDRPGEGMAQAAHLRDPKSGRNMTLWTNQLALQVYSANGFEGSFENSEGECVVQHGALCLEPQAPPGALHHDDLGSLIVEPGTPYVNRSFFCFFVN